MEWAPEATSSNPCPFAYHANSGPATLFEKMWNMLSVQDCTPLAVSSHSIFLGGKNRGSRVFEQAHGWTGVPKKVPMGRWDVVCAIEGRNDMIGVTKEPCYRCTEGTGGKNWPKRKSVPQP